MSDQQNVEKAKNPNDKPPSLGETPTEKVTQTHADHATLKKSYLPTPDILTGLSKKVIGMMMVIVVGVVMSVFLLLIHYSHKTAHPIAHDGVDTIDIKGAENKHLLMANIDQDPVVPNVAGASQHPATQTSSHPARSANDSYNRSENNHTPEKSLSGALTEKEFEQASQSEIDVFSGNTQQNSIANVHADPANPSPYAGDYGAGTQGVNNPYDQQNGQSQKVAFLKASQQSSPTFIASQLEKPLSPYEVKAGTLIPATMMTGIDSDLPSQIIAKVRQHVYDSITGNHLLIPQGTTLIGTYDSKVAYGQSRILIVWSRLIYPNGDSFDLKGMQGVDLAGMAGLKDQVDHHYTRVFGSALMFSVFGALGQLSQPKVTGDQLTNQQLIYGAIGQQMNQTAMQMVAKNMNIQPTINIRAGAHFNVLLARDMVLEKPYAGR